jgi:hypothetical protein
MDELPVRVHNHNYNESRHYSDVIWGIKNCQELVEIGKAYMDLAREVDKAVQYSGDLQSTKERITIIPCRGLTL